MKEWYYSQGDQEIGPVSDARMIELSRAGAFDSETLVWTEGMADWVPHHTQGFGERLATGGSGSEVRPAQEMLPHGDPMLPDSQGFGEHYGTCEVSGEVRPVKEMLQYGDKWILPEYKDRFVQSLQESPTRGDIDMFWNEYEFTDPGKRAILAKVGIAASIVAVLVVIVGFALITVLLDPSISPGGANSAAPVVSSLFPSLMLVAVAIGIAGQVLYLMWVHRVVKNAHVLHRGPLDQTPGWAVGFHFIPIASLWKPYLAIKHSWNASQGKPLKASANLVGWWWGCYLAVSLLGAYLFPAGIAAVILQWIIITRITRWQQDRAGLI